MAQSVRNDGLTHAEGQVMDALADAVLAYDDLEIQHPNERAEFYTAIHRAQDLLAVRICRRLYPDAWVNHSQSGPT